MAEGVGRRADRSAEVRRAARFLTSVRLQAIEFSHLRVLLTIVLGLPIVIFVMTYYGTPASAPPVHLLVPDEAGDVAVAVPQRIGYSEGMGVMGVGWALATVAFFAVTGNLERDRRLVLSGYRAWQILLARLTILAGLSLPLAVVAMAPATVVMPANHPELVFLADLCGALISAGFGMLVGTLIPRATEGVLVVVVVIGLGMSLGQDAGRIFFLYPALQLLISGRLAQDPPVVVYLWQSALVMALFLIPALGLWWWRTRIIRHPQATVGPSVGRDAAQPAPAEYSSGKRDRGRRSRA